MTKKMKSQILQRRKIKQVIALMTTNLLMVRVRAVAEQIQGVLNQVRQNQEVRAQAGHPNQVVEVVVVEVVVVVVKAVGEILVAPHHLLNQGSNRKGIDIIYVFLI